MRMRWNRAIPSALLLAGAVALVSCVDEDVVFDNRPIYQTIADSARGFVGYADPSSESKLTFCGQCHGDMQAQWEQTAHADAWAGLQSSDHAQEFCEACHTVNSLGNVLPEPTPGQAVGGHIAVETGRYHDVQCESCHGPGLEHVLGPASANVPLAPAEVGTDLSFGCGECHQGAHHPFVEEWEESEHGNVIPFAAENESDGCYLCHSGEGALTRLGVDADYLEKEALLGSDHYAQITCVVCHDPHGSDNAAQLRFPVTTTDTDQHLCAVCHDRQARADTNPLPEYLRTHAPAAGLMDGDAGWFPPGSGIGPSQITHAHGSAERLCASCHVVAYTAVDPETEEEFISQGHRFLGAPCVGEGGRPTDRQDCVFTAEARDFQGCLSCHGSEEEAAQLLRDALSDLLPRVRALQARLREIDPNGTGAGGEIDPGDFRYTVAEGAYFNLTVAVSADGLPSSDQSARWALAPTVVHNPPLIAALVEASLDALDAEYGGAALTAAATTSGDPWPER
jgi:predicted CXXCH cytochrome family protein